MPVAFEPPRGVRDTVSPVRVDPTGRRGPTRGQARSAAWRRSSQGLYVPSEVDRHRPEQRIVEAAALVPAYGGLTGWAALRWLGGRWFGGLETDGKTPRDVEIATIDWIRAQPGMRPVEERLAPDDLTVGDGLRMTTVPRSVCFEMRYARNLRWAVVAMDMAAASDLCSIAEAAGYASGLQGWIGIPQCRAALALADENSWSPYEPIMRMVWMLDAGLPRPLCNQPVFDLDGRHVATPDLLDVEAGVAGEYDGGVHLTAARRADDLVRESKLRDLGLECFTMVSRDLADPFSTVVPRMLAARERAAGHPERRRRWTIEPPAWWRPTVTVEQRRALSPEDRDRLLRYRVA